MKPCGTNYRTTRLVNQEVDKSIRSVRRRTPVLALEILHQESEVHVGLAFCALVVVMCDPNVMQNMALLIRRRCFFGTWHLHHSMVSFFC